MTSRLPVCVVGGGTAGSTFVAGLAARSDVPIVLVEPGPVSPHDDVARFFDVLDDPSLLCRHEARFVEDGPTGTLLGARALGGGSAVNGMLLTGKVPPGLEGLTRRCDEADAGPVGRALLRRGGRPTRLWWNNGRWNPGRAAHHLVEEGRVDRIVGSVDSLVVADGRCTGVVVDGNVLATRAVVLCAGAVDTPAILLRSGLGEVDAAIGTGLQNHPEVWAEFDVLEDGSPGVFDASVTSESVTTNGRRLLTVAYDRTPERHPGRGRLSVVLLDVVSRGSVSLHEGDLVVNFRSLSDRSDLVAMREAARLLAALVVDLERSGDIARPVLCSTPVSSMPTDDGELDRWLCANVGVVSHPASSCSASLRDDGSLLCVDGVWVADASGMPRVPSCTPAGEVVVLARRISDVVAEAVGFSGSTTQAEQTPHVPHDE